MGHGVSNRMTGGGTGFCLQTLEAGGMGEGWSDALAEYVASYIFFRTNNIGFFVALAGRRNLLPRSKTSN